MDGIFRGTIRGKQVYYRKGFVPEEMNLVEVVCDELEAKSFIPSIWKYVEAYLSSNGVFEVPVREALPQSFNHCRSNFMLLW